MHYRLSALLITLLALVGSAEAQQRQTGPYIQVSPTPSKLSQGGPGFVQIDANGIASIAAAVPGSGTVTNTAGALAIGSLVVGNSGADVKTIGGIIGGALTTAGPITFANGAVGTTFQLPVGGPFNYIFPPASQTLASLAGGETFANKIYAGGQLSGTFNGNPIFAGVPSFTGLSPGVQTRCLGLDAANNLVLLNAGCGSGGGGSPWTITDGVNTVPGVTQVTVTGGTVGGSSPNATLTIASGGTVTKNGNLATNQIVTGGNNGTSDIKTNTTGLNVLTALSTNVSSPGAFAKNNGDALSGTFTGAPTFSGGVVFSGFPRFTGLSTGTIAAGKNLGLDVGNNLVVANVVGSGATGSGVNAGTTPQTVTGTATISSPVVYVATGWVTGTLTLPAISTLGPSPSPYCIVDSGQNVDATHTLSIKPDNADSIGGGTVGAGSLVGPLTNPGDDRCFRVAGTTGGHNNWTNPGIPTQAPVAHNFLIGAGLNNFPAAQPNGGDLSDLPAANTLVTSTGTGLGGVVPGVSGNVATSTGTAWISAPPTGGAAAFTVDTNAALATLNATTGTQVIRMGFAARGDTEPLLYRGTGSACGAGGNPAADNGACTTSANGNGFVAMFSGTNRNVDEWGCAASPASVRACIMAAIAASYSTTTCNVLWFTGAYNLDGMAGLVLGNGSSSTESTLGCTPVLRGNGNPFGITGFFSSTHIATAPRIFSTSVTDYMIAVKGPLFGFGVQNLIIDCTGNAAPPEAIRYISASGGDSRNLSLLNCASGLVGRTVAIPSGMDHSDAGSNVFDHIYIKTPDIAATTGINISGDGSGTVTSDVDFNEFSNVIIWTTSTGANFSRPIYVQVSDSNIFRNVWMPGGATSSALKAVVLDYTVNTGFPNSTIFQNIDTGTFAWENSGTPSIGSGVNNIIGLMRGNGAANPSLSGLNCTAC